LHPWFIEICRRVRLYHGAKGRISARTVGSVRALVEAKHLRGHIGDPWIPVSKGEDPAAFNSSPTYQKVSAVLFADDWLRPILLEWHDGIDRLPMRVRFDVTVRGQGTTGGQHLREVPIDNDRRRAFLFDSAERDRLAKIAGQMMKDASTLNSPIIKTSHVTLIKGGASKVRLDDPASDWVEHWLKAADKRIEEEFFEYLFELAGTGDHQRWGSFLRRLAKQIFDAAARTVPISGVRRLKALAVAERRLWGGFRTYLPGHMPEGVEETADVE
jgi:CRISPR system Cascade subunit CasA